MYPTEQSPPPQCDAQSGRVSLCPDGNDELTPLDRAPVVGAVGGFVGLEGLLTAISSTGCECSEEDGAQKPE